MFTFKSLKFLHKKDIGFKIIIYPISINLYLYLCIKVHPTINNPIVINQNVIVDNISIV